MQSRAQDLQAIRPASTPLQAAVLCRSTACFQWICMNRSCRQPFLRTWTSSDLAQELRKEAGQWVAKYARGGSAGQQRAGALPQGQDPRAALQRGAGARSHRAGQVKPSAEALLTALGQHWVDVLGRHLPTWQAPFSVSYIPCVALQRGVGARPHCPGQVMPSAEVLFIAPGQHWADVLHPGRDPCAAIAYEAG